MSALVEAPPYGSPEWLAWRSHGIGASELASLVGADPYRGEYALALLKRGLSDDFTGNVATAWGQRIEGVALDAYEEFTGTVVYRGETWADERWPHLWATLDGRTGRVGVEVKATTRWQVPPPHVRVQALAQMGLADLEAVDVVRVSPYGEPIITRLDRDDGAIGDLLDLGEAWYVRFVLGDEMPPVDGSREASRHLDTQRGDAETVATAEQATLAGALHEMRRRRDELESQERAVVNALKASMAGTGVLVGDGFRVTWQAVKGRTTVDWQSVALDVALTLLDMAGPEDPALRERAEAVVEAASKRHTNTGEGTTRFVPTWQEEEGES